MALDYWCHECGKQVTGRTENENEGPVCGDCGGGFIERHDATNPQMQPNPFGFAPQGHNHYENLFSRFAQDFLTVQRRRRTPEQMDVDNQNGTQNETQNGTQNGSEESNEGEREENANGRPRANPRNAGRRRFTVQARRGPNGGLQYVGLDGLDGNQRNPNGDGPQGNTGHPLLDLLGPLLGLRGNLADYGFGANLEEILARSMNDEVKGAPPTSKEALNALTPHKVTDQIRTDHVSCSVCMVEYELNEDVISLPCEHLFHSSCIQPWLKLHNTCPVCRSALPSEDDNKKQEHPSSDPSASSSNNRTNTDQNANHSNSTDGPSPDSQSPLSNPDDQHEDRQSPSNATPEEGNVSDANDHHDLPDPSISWFSSFFNQ